MPRIETHSFIHSSGAKLSTDVFFGKMREHTSYQLRYEKVFFIKLDDDVSRLHGGNYIYADTFKECTEKWEDVMINYMDSARSFSKVIAISVSSIIFEEFAKELKITLDHTNYRNTHAGRPHLAAEAYPTSRLELSYHVGYILTIGKKKFWSYFDENNYPKTYTYTPDSLNKDDSSNYGREWGKYKFIEWTEEREVWIKGMYKSFNKVIAQCRKFYEQDENKIAIQMDSNSKLLTN